MVLGGEKRPAPAPVANPRAPKRAKGDAAVAQALEEADHLPQAARDMLIAGFKDSAAGRHPFQEKFLGFVLDALNAVEVKLTRKVEEAEKTVKAMPERATALADAQKAAAKDLTESEAAVEAAEAEVTEAAEAADDTKKAVDGAEAALREFDMTIGVAAMERHQLEEIAATPASVTSPLIVDLLRNLLSDFDAGLPTGALLDQIGVAISAREQAIRNGAARRMTVKEALDEARVVHEAAEEDCKAQRSFLDEVCAVRNDCSSKLKRAADAVRLIPEDKARARSELSACRTQLSRLQTGPLAHVRSAAQPPASVPSSATAKKSAPVSLEVPTVAPPNMDRIRRRRMSWLPRKMLELRRPSLGKAVPSVAKGAPPTEIRRAPTPQSSPSAALTGQAAVSAPALDEPAARSAASASDKCGLSKCAGRKAAAKVADDDDSDNDIH